MCTREFVYLFPFTAFISAFSNETFLFAVALYDCFAYDIFSCGRRIIKKC